MLHQLRLPVLREGEGQIPITIISNLVICAELALKNDCLSHFQEFLR